MSQYVDTKGKAFYASGAIAANTRVKLNTDGTVSTAGIADVDIGTARHAVADGESVTVLLRSGQGTHRMVAAAAVTAGDDVFTAASGKVSVSAATAYPVGTALETATGDGQIIEVVYNAHGDSAVA